MRTLGFEFSILFISTVFIFLEEKGLYDEYAQWFAKRIVKALKIV
jgi:hypothetical protein